MPDDAVFCTECRDAKYLPKHDNAGKCLGWAMCRCQLEAKISAIVPPEYWGVTMENFQPRTEAQRAAFEAMRATPRGSFFLAGLQGLGKTLLCYLLVREAIAAGRKVVVCDLPTLIEQHQRAATSEHAPPPLCTAESIRADRSQLVFLDEFDKLNLTSFTYRKVFELMQAIYSYRVQLLVASNLSSGNLEAQLVSRDENYGLSIVRRLFESQGMQEFVL